jgi:hypothetical protein
MVNMTLLNHGFIRYNDFICFLLATSLDLTSKQVDSSIFVFFMEALH